MRMRRHLATPLVIAALCTAPVVMSACGGGHQVYDPYYGDYHRWNGAEDGFYRQWEGETRRGHMDFGARPATEQHAYYDWRHQH